MRIFVLFLAFFLAFNTAMAESSFPIDEEFQTEFTGFDEKEFKAYEKEQKTLAKLNKKRKKLEDKKIKLEKKRDASIENCERSQIYIEKLKTTEEL